METSGAELRASGLYSQLKKYLMALYVYIARVVLAPLDPLNRQLQGASCSVSDLLEGLLSTGRLLRAQRDQAKSLVGSLRRKVEQSGPGEKKSPARFSEEGSDQIAANIN